MDLTGRRFGRLTVVRRIGSRKDKYRSNTVWGCLCDCGKTKDVITGSLTAGLTKSCGCLWEEASRRNFELSKRPIGEANFNLLLRNYKHAADQRDIPFELSREEFRKLTSSDCYYCRVGPSQLCEVRDKNGNPRLRGAYKYNGVDRVDSNGPYNTVNCVPCCKTCNYAKNTLDHDSFIVWLRRIAKVWSDQ